MCSFPLMVKLHELSQSHLRDLYQSYAIRRRLLIHEIKTAVETTRSHAGAKLSHAFIIQTTFLTSKTVLMNF